MKEKQLWAFIKKRCGRRWLTQRHEDSISVGIPDVSFALKGAGHGWIELKAVEPPSDVSAVVRVPHFTYAQRAWLTEFGLKGGGCFVILAVGGCILLFGYTAVYKISELTLNGLRETALYWAEKEEFNAVAFLDAIRRFMTDRD